MNLPEKVLVLHSLPPESATPDRTVDEFDLHGAAQNVARVLPGAVIAGIRGEVHELAALLHAHQPDVVFNVCEAPQGRPDREAQLAALLELLRMPFTGSSSETLALCRRKDRTKAVLRAAGVAVPRDGHYPCIVKPAAEDGSAGITADSLCNTPGQAARQRDRLVVPVVIEEFLPGREFAVALWGRHHPDYHSIGETRFLHGLRLITYAAKWDPDSPDYANTPLDYHTAMDPDLEAAVLAAARAAWIAVEARGYLRIDIRLNAAGIPHVLDVNPNPELGEGVGICRAVQEAGWSWERFVHQQIAWATEPA